MTNTARETDLIKTPADLADALAPIVSALDNSGSMPESDLAYHANLTIDRLLLSHRDNRPRGAERQMIALNKARFRQGIAGDAIRRLYSVLL